jgi:hypothetical protein
MNMNARILSNTLLICSLIVFSVSGQNLLLNGGFESPEVPTNTYQSDIPSNWGSGGGPIYLFNGSPSSSWPQPEEGEQYVDIGNESIDGPLFQTFTVTNQGLYLLRWYDNTGQNGLTTSPYSAMVFSPTHTIIMSNNYDAFHASGSWMARTNAIVLLSGTYTLQFQAEGVYNGLDTLLDNVSLMRDNVMITMQPQSQVGYYGGSATFSVVATNGLPPLSYQWWFTNSMQIPGATNAMRIPGATNATLAMTDLQFTNAGAYSVVVSDSVGDSIPSSNANLIVNPAGVSLALFPGLIISGVVGSNYVIQSTTNLNITNSWMTVANLTLLSPVELWVDTNTDASLPANPHRFYHVLLGH